jgi:hypothetical protein
MSIKKTIIGVLILCMSETRSFYTERGAPQYHDAPVTLPDTGFPFHRLQFADLYGGIVAHLHMRKCFISLPLKQMPGYCPCAQNSTWDTDPYHPGSPMAPFIENYGLPLVSLIHSLMCYKVLRSLMQNHVAFPLLSRLCAE